MRAMDTLRPHERRWPATLTVLIVLALQLSLPRSTRGVVWWLLPVIGGLLLIPVVVTNPMRLERETGLVRGAALALAGVMSLANAVSLLVLVERLLRHREQMKAPEIILAGILIWTTNVAATAVLFWETDRGGPFVRDPAHGRDGTRPDLLFPQMQGVPGWDARAWRPSFVDYLFTAFTMATAFSPTDTLPLSARAKLLTAMDAAVSLVTVGVLLARAVNVI
jgi:hypothetical protein